MSPRLRVIAPLCLALALGACSSALRWTPEYHVVRSGETLYAIAVRYDIDYRRLAAWNGLGDGTYIRAGQRLRLRPPVEGEGAPAAGDAVAAPVAESPAPEWRWPTAGRVVEAYGASPRTRTGVRIGGATGQPVVAVAAGEVVYAGDGLPGYGLLVIVRHNATWLSAYGFNERLLVAEGDRVGAGQAIARMGAARSGDAQLHFEIRRNGRPVDPLELLPGR